MIFRRNLNNLIVLPAKFGWNTRGQLFAGTAKSRTQVMIPRDHVYHRLLVSQHGFWCYGTRDELTPDAWEDSARRESLPDAPGGFALEMLCVTANIESLTLPLLAALVG